jgi:hypothetical protein
MNVPTAKQILLDKGYSLVQRHVETSPQFHEYRWFIKNPEGKAVNPNPKGISNASMIALAVYVQKNS